MSRWFLFLLLLLPVVLAVSLSERVDELDEKSFNLVNKARYAKKLTKDLRTELVTFFLDFVQIHQEVIEDGDPTLLFKVSRIAARLRAGLRVGLPHIKKRLSKVVSGLLAPLFFPFYLMEETNNQMETTPIPQLPSPPSAELPTPPPQVPQFPSQSAQPLVPQSFGLSQIPFAFYYPRQFANPFGLTNQWMPSNFPEMVYPYR